jgi:5-hydroxyisourate hydrolase
VSTLSTHVLDTALGRPAKGIRVSLERGGAELGAGITDGDGRVKDLWSKDTPLAPGSYQLRFYVAEYFSAASRETFYTEIAVSFELTERDAHYHVPLLLSPFGYSTYRGS